MQRFEDLKDMITKSPTPYHFTDNARKILIEAGYEEIQEAEKPEKIPKKGFFVRDDRCLACWNDNGHEHGSIIASHSDSPGFILKPYYSDDTKAYKKCRCSIYGGGKWYTWIGRGLRLAGKVTLKLSPTLQKTVLYDSKRAVGFIPYNNANPLEPVYDAESHFLVVTSTGDSSNSLNDIIAKDLGVSASQIQAFDLRFVDANPPNLFSGIITGQKLDDMICTFSAFTSFVNTEPSQGVTNIFVAFDNEEIGSSTHCGGHADIINDVINILIPSKQERRVFKRRSIIGSADVVHASHPNYEDKTDPKNLVEQGKGVALSVDSGCCDTAWNDMIPLFEYINLNKKTTVGMPSKGQVRVTYGSQTGSTIGPMSETRTGILTFDFGQALLAMHSIRETASLKDLEDNYQFCAKFYTMTVDEWNNFI